MGEERLNPTEHDKLSDVEIREDLKQQHFELELIQPHSPDFEEAKRVEGEIFSKAFNNSAEEMEREYGPYERASQFLVVRDRQSNKIAGIIRLISHSAAGFKSLDDLGKQPWGVDTAQLLVDNGIEYDPATTIDIATLGVAEGYRKQDEPGLETQVSLSLYHGLCKFSKERNVRYWVTILDDRVLELVQQIGEPFERFTGVESASYLGSKSSTPVWCDFPKAAERLRAKNHNLYDVVVEGKTLNKDLVIPESLH